DPPLPPPTHSVRICRRSGLKAGRYCEDVVSKSFVVGEEPDGPCNACKPPPPPEPDPEHVNRSAESHDAVLVSKAGPEYPEELHAAGVEGSVEVSYTVDENGRVTDISVSRSSGNRALDDCAKKAIRKFRYKPAEQGGKPREVHRSWKF